MSQVAREKIVNQFNQFKKHELYYDIIISTKGKKAAIISRNVQEYITNLTGHTRNKFHGNHPEYQQHKQQFPFLRNIEIRLEDVEKQVRGMIHKNFVKELVELNQYNREYIVKSTEGMTHYDTIEKRIIVSRSPLYKWGHYCQSYIGHDFIKRECMEKERRTGGQYKTITTKIIPEIRQKKESNPVFNAAIALSSSYSDEGIIAEPSMLCEDSVQSLEITSLKTATGHSVVKLSSLNQDFNVLAKESKILPSIILLSYTGCALFNDSFE